MWSRYRGNPPGHHTSNRRHHQQISRHRHQSRRRRHLAATRCRSPSTSAAADSHHHGRFVRSEGASYTLALLPETAIGTPPTTRRQGCDGYLGGMGRLPTWAQNTPPRQPTSYGRAKDRCHHHARRRPTTTAPASNNLTLTVNNVATTVFPPSEVHKVR